MGRHLAYTAVSRKIAALVALAGLLGALAAIALPTGSGPSPEVSAVLAVGALALLAGHAWGLLIVAASDLILVGGLWPLLAFHRSPHSVTLAAALALAGALPGLVVFTRTLPGTVELVLGDRPRFRSYAVALTGMLALASLILPVFSA
jgi:hypothetical protein